MSDSNDDDSLLRPGNTSDRTVSATTKPPRRGAGVRKMNRVPLAIGIGTAAVVAGVILYTANQRAHRHSGGGTTEETAGPMAAAPPSDLALAQHRAAQAHDAEQARTRQIVAQAQAPHSASPGQPQQRPVGPYDQAWQQYYQELEQDRQKRASELASAVTGDTAIGGNALDNAPSNGTTPKQPVDNDYLASYRTGARNALEVKEGTIIPAALIGGINSDVAGMIKAQVRENVYDSATGQKVLIPQGSSVIGEFRRSVGYGQTRIEVAFTRIIFPDQSSIDLGEMEGADMAGNAGFEDQVNNHWFKVFGNALLAAAFGAGVQLSQNNNSLGGGGGGYGTGGYSSQQIIAAQLGQQVGELGMEIARRGLNIPPTITIRPGYQFNVMVRKDMILPAYQDRWGNGLLHRVSDTAKGGR